MNSPVAPTNLDKLLTIDVAPPPPPTPPPGVKTWLIIVASETEPKVELVNSYESIYVAGNSAVGFP